MSHRRVGLLYDYTFARRPGGAQRLAECIAGSVPLNEVDLVPCPPGGVDRDCDGYALLLTKRYSDEELGFVCKHSAFVRYEMDYWYDYEPQVVWRDKLNAAARCVMFCSPLHQDVYWTIHPGGTGGEVVACYLDPSRYLQVGATTTKDNAARAVWFGEWRWGKGPDVAQKWSGEQGIKLDMYGPSIPSDAEPDNAYVTICGMAAEDGWLERVASYGTFVMMPREPQCYPYGPLEAYLLGLNVVLTGRFGIESFPHGRDLDATIALGERGASRFWDLTLNSLFG